MRLLATLQFKVKEKKILPKVSEDEKPILVQHKPEKCWALPLGDSDPLSFLKTICFRAGVYPITTCYYLNEKQEWKEFSRYTINENMSLMQGLKNESKQAIFEIHYGNEEHRVIFSKDRYAHKVLHGLVVEAYTRGSDKEYNEPSLFSPTAPLFFRENRGPRRKGGVTIIDFMVKQHQSSADSATKPSSAASSARLTNTGDSAASSVRLTNTGAPKAATADSAAIDIITKQIDGLQLP
jgi:hypothetical protein